MRKFREWMHTTGRNKVIAVVFLIAIAIVLHYFIVERDGYIGQENQIRLYRQSQRKKRLLAEIPLAVLILIQP